MEKFKFISGKLLLCLCELAVGILLFIDPVGFTASIITAVGIVLILMGIISIIRYFRAAPDTARLEQGLVKGICSVLAGAFGVMKAEWLISIFPLLTIAYGVTILVTGIVRVQWAADMLRMKTGRWYIAAIGALLSIILAVIILCNPFGTTAFLWTFTAVTLIVEAVIDILVMIFMGFKKTER